MFTFLFFAVLTLLISAFIVTPIFRSHARKDYSNNKGVNYKGADLIDRKETIYSHIKDIEFDYEMGKLSKEDFENLRQRYKDEAVEVLKEIDRIYGKPVKAKKMLSKQKRSKTDGKQAANFCWICGAALADSDRFCPNCGNKIE